MCPLNRKIRERVRQLPPPPYAEVQQLKVISPIQSKNKVKEIRVDEKFLSKINNFYQERIDESHKENASVININNSSTKPPARVAKKTIMSELSEVFEEGIQRHLSEVDEDVPEPKTQLNYYQRLKKDQYKQSVKDYEDAGKKLQESGLFTNASISFGCAVLAELISEQSIHAAISQYEKIYSLANISVQQSSFFSLLFTLFKSIKNHDSIQIKRQIEKLKYIETFSSDDQELLAKSVDYLSSLFSY